MTEKIRKESFGEECNLRTKNEWSIITISEILSNDFYIGTLRQKKYRRKKINGSDEKLQKTDYIVIANNHEAIVDYKVFSAVQEQIKLRSTSNYREVKKYDNVYTGHLFCGDCGSPMFSMRRADLPSAYRCGTYHRHDVKACSSHHTRVDMLVEIYQNQVEDLMLQIEGFRNQIQLATDKHNAIITINRTAKKYY